MLTKNAEVIKLKMISTHKMTPVSLSGYCQANRSDCLTDKPLAAEKGGRSSASSHSTRLPQDCIQNISASVTETRRPFLI